MRVLAIILALWVVFPAWGASPSEQLDDPALEARARALSKELRCLVCQNQSIDDSDAEFAKDMRLVVRERLLAGDTDEEVMAYLTDRYGTFVRLKPPLNTQTLILWIAPFVVVVIALLAGGLYVRNRRSAGADHDGLTADEEAALAALLDARGRAKGGAPPD